MMVLVQQPMRTSPLKIQTGEDKVTEFTTINRVMKTISKNIIKIKLSLNVFVIFVEQS